MLASSWLRRSPVRVVLTLLSAGVILFNHSGPFGVFQPQSAPIKAHSRSSAALVSLGSRCPAGRLRLLLTRAVHCVQECPMTMPARQGECQMLPSAFALKDNVDPARAYPTSWPGPAASEWTAPSHDYARLPPRLPSVDVTAAAQSYDHGSAVRNTPQSPGGSCPIPDCHECAFGQRARARSYEPVCSVCKNKRYLSPDGRQCTVSCEGYSGAVPSGTGVFFRTCVPPSERPLAPLSPSGSQTRPVQPAVHPSQSRCGPACRQCADEAEVGTATLCQVCMPGALLLDGHCFRSEGEVERHLHAAVEKAAPAVAEQHKTVEIWGIDPESSENLWLHLLRQPLHGDAHTQYGDAVYAGVHYVFRGGFGVLPQTVPPAVHVVLVLDAQDPMAMHEVSLWLQHISQQRIQRLGLVLQGTAECNSLPAWLRPYRKLFQFVYIGPAVSLVEPGLSPVHGWVAPIRFTFPQSREAFRRLAQPRSVHCILSAHDTLQLQQAKPLADLCLLVDASATSRFYRLSLHQADYAIIPSGPLAESFIWEAMECGAVPVVYNRPYGQCSVLEQLRREKAPVFWIQDWTQLPSLVVDLPNTQSHLSAVVAKRKEVLAWLEVRKRRLATEFLERVHQDLLQL